MAITKDRATELFNKAGMRKPSDGMLRELVDLAETKNLITDDEINQIIGRHARKNLRNESSDE